MTPFTLLAAILGVLLLHGATASRHHRALTQAPLEEEAEGPEADYALPEFSCDFQGPFPYAASLRDDRGDYRCGAVLIQKDAVLTAASCVGPSLHDSVGVSEVFLGGLDREVPIETRSIVAVLPHPDFTGDPVDGFDLAVIKFSNETCLDPIPNLGRQTAAGEQYTILGFGRTGVMQPLSGALQFANVTNFDIETCNTVFGVTPPLDDNKLCTQTPACNCASICEGDEGGGVVLVETVLQFTDTLMGIMSYSSADCDAEGGYGIHTDVQPYLNWIFRTLQSPEFENAR